MPYATHILRPADVGLFSTLKMKWKEAVRIWQLDHIGETLSKSIFPGIFCKAWKASTTTELAMNAFRRTGLYPFKFESVDHSRISALTENDAPPIAPVFFIF